MTISTPSSDVNPSKNQTQDDIQELFPETWTYPDLSSKNTPLNTIANLEILLDMNSICVRKNLMARRTVYSGLQSSQHVYPALIKSLCAKHGLAYSKVDEYLEAIAEKWTYHPVKIWVDSKPWDGVSRIGELVSTVKTESPLASMLITKWLIGAIAILYDSKEVNLPGVLIFQGLQYCGKTSWLKSLCGPDFRLTGRTLDPTNKDSVEQITSTWLVELGELESTYKKDMAALKAFITNTYDCYRKSYAREALTYKRQTAFFGSVNKQVFLNDETGNRRWWVIPVESLNAEHNIDMQQLWAEVKTLWGQGESFHLSANELSLLNESNEDAQIEDPIGSLFYESFDFTLPPSRWISPSAIAKRIEDYTRVKICPKRLGMLLKTLYMSKKLSRKKLDGYNLYHLP